MEIQSFVKIKRIVAIWLTVCFLLSITAVVVNAASDESEEDEKSQEEYNKGYESGRKWGLLCGQLDLKNDRGYKGLNYKSKVTPRTKDDFVSRLSPKFKEGYADAFAEAYEEGYSSAGSDPESDVSKELEYRLGYESGEKWGLSSGELDLRNDRGYKGLNYKATVTPRTIDGKTDKFTADFKKGYAKAYEAAYNEANPRS